MDRYRDLAAKVDAFFARVAARHGDEMRCASGCDACCRTRLTITTVEAEALAALVRALPPAARARLREVATREAPDRCAALDDDGRCLVYDARPIVCRSHGVPIRMGDVVDACRLNFARRGPAAADADCILDQTTLSAMLYAIDRAPARHDLAAVLVAALDEADA